MGRMVPPTGPGRSGNVRSAAQLNRIASCSAEGRKPCATSSALQRYVPMSMPAPAVDRSTLGLHSLESYAPIIGTDAAERILAKADRVRTMKVAHVSSTFYGGGVTEILTPLTLLMN